MLRNCDHELLQCKKALPILNLNWMPVDRPEPDKNASKIGSRFKLHLNSPVDHTEKNQLSLIDLHCIEV